MIFIQSSLLINNYLPPSYQSQSNYSPMSRTHKKRKSTHFDSNRQFRWITPSDEFASEINSDEDQGEYNDGDLVVEAMLTCSKVEFSFHETSLHDQSGADDDSSSDPALCSLLDNHENLSLIKEYRKVRAVQRKSQKVYKPPKIECPHCDKVLHNNFQFNRHMISHRKRNERLKESDFICEICERPFKSRVLLRMHSKVHTENCPKCSVCSKKFTHRGELLSHLVVHTGDKPYECSFCTVGCSTPANLRTHLKARHPETPYVKNHICPHCGEKLSSVAGANQHVLEEHSEIVDALRIDHMNELARKMDAKLVDKERKRQRQDDIDRRRIHDYEHLTKIGVREWEITYEFFLGDGLVEGKDWAKQPTEGKESLDCEICDRTFFWKYEMMFHEACHRFDESGQADNKKCLTCDLVFKKPIGLKYHMLTHTDEEPLLCLHCNSPFASHIDLKFHIRFVHSADPLQAISGGFKPEPSPVVPAKRLSSAESATAKRKPTTITTSATTKRKLTTTPDVRTRSAKLPSSESDLREPRRLSKRVSRLNNNNLAKTSAEIEAERQRQDVQFDKVAAGEQPAQYAQLDGRAVESVVDARAMETVVETDGDMQYILPPQAAAAVHGGESFYVIIQNDADFEQHDQSHVVAATSSTSTNEMVAMNGGQNELDLRAEMPILTAPPATNAQPPLPPTMNTSDGVTYMPVLASTGPDDQGAYIYVSEENITALRSSVDVNGFSIGQLDPATNSATVAAAAEVAAAAGTLIAAREGVSMCNDVKTNNDSTGTTVIILP